MREQVGHVARVSAHDDGDRVARKRDRTRHNTMEHRAAAELHELLGLPEPSRGPSGQHQDVETAHGSG